MKKIVFYSRDPGGTNALISIYESLSKKYSIEVYGKDYAVGMFNKSNIECKRVGDNNLQIDRELKDVLYIKKPVAIITGQSSGDCSERILWMIAKECGIKCFSILDSWCSYDERFPVGKTGERIVPDCIFVMDREAKDSLIELGIKEESIKITGQPYLQFVKKKYDAIKTETIEQYKNSIGIKKRMILYVSDYIKETFGTDYYGYDQFTVFDDLVNVLDGITESEDCVLVVRPHPKEITEKWRGIIKKKNHRFRIIVDSESRSEDAIMASDLMIGSWSMIMVEAAIAHIDLISVQIGAKRKPEFFLEQKGLINPIYTIEKLTEELGLFFEDGRNKVDIKGVIKENGIDEIESIIEGILGDS